MKSLFDNEYESEPLETSLDVTLNTKNVTFQSSEEEEVLCDGSISSSLKSKLSDKRNRTIIRWLCVYIVALTMAAGGILGGVCGGLQVCSFDLRGSRKSKSDSVDGPSNPFQGSNEDDRIDEDEFRGPIQSFDSKFELQTAVQLYSDYDRNSVRKYGKSISEWDVSNIEDFSYLFDSRRIGNQKLLTDESFHLWNMSSAKTLEGMFLGQRRFQGRGLEHWDTSQVTSLRSTFADCPLFNGNLSKWDTGQVKDMSFILAGSKGFVGNISSWNTSSVTSLEYAFYGLSYFNSDISSWDVTNVRNMSSTFNRCETFRNKDLTSWNTSAALDMSYMFHRAKRFDGNVSTWDVQNVRNLRSFLDGAESFSGDLSHWQPISCIDLSYAFRGTRRFDSDLGNWDVQNVNTLAGTFQDARVFTGKGLERWNTSSVRTLFSTFDLSNIGNIDVSKWDTHNVEDFSFAFYGTRVNSNLSHWDTSSGITFRSMFNEADRFNSSLFWNVSSAVDMSEMFEQASSFQGHGLGGWDVSNVQTFFGMFDRSAFNSDISSWDVRNCQDFDSMFAETSFNYDVSSWDVRNALRMERMFYQSSFQQNLCAWDDQVSTDSVVVSRMFQNSSCPVTKDPQRGGPWCTECK